MRVVELFTFYYEGGTWYPARTGPLCSYELFISAIPRPCARPHFNLADECARELHKHRIAVSILNLSRCPVLTMRARVKRIFSIDPRQPRPQLGPRRVRLILHVFIRLNRLLGGGGASACLRTRVSLIPFPGAPRVLFRATLLYRTLLPIDPSNRSQLCLRLLLSLIARGPQRVLVNAWRQTRETCWKKDSGAVKFSPKRRVKRGSLTSKRECSGSVSD